MTPTWSRLWLPLKVKEGRLFGRRKGQVCEILPEDIVDIKEFAYSRPPYLVVVTAYGQYYVRATGRRYDEVVRILERYVGSDFCNRPEHRWIAFFYRKQFRVRSLFALLFRPAGKKQTETEQSGPGSTHAPR